MNAYYESVRAAVTHYVLLHGKRVFCMGGGKSTTIGYFAKDGTPMFLERITYR